jgi:hypothetical protein
VALRHQVTLILPFRRANLAELAKNKNGFNGRTGN